MASDKQKAQEWISARKLRHLSHAQVQMARELGMNPKGLGKLDNHHQEPWKMPLPEFIEHLYRKRFGKVLSGDVPSVEDRLRAREKKEKARSEEKKKRREARKGLATSAEEPRQVDPQDEELPF